MATINGTSANNTLIGTAGADTIRGFAGDDIILAGAGNDTVQGGDGNDIITGGTGDDLLDGGNGNDTLFDDAGSNRFIGGAGNDNITSRNALLAVIDAGDGDDRISTTDTQFVEIAGGIGNDDITITGATLAHVDSGAGADRIRVSDVAGFTLVESGSGDDTIEIATARSGVIAGSGNDRIVVGVGAEQVTISGGTGSDTVVLATASARVTLTDFVGGANGDVLDISRLLTGLNGWDQSTNPFGAGYLRVTQSGSDTLLQVDLDGAGGAAGWTSVTVLQGVPVNSLGVANFGPAYPPNGSAPAGSTIIGTAVEDFLNGTIGADTIYGRDGGDEIRGNGGNDTIFGEGGNDFIFGGGGNDVINGGDGSDSLNDDIGSNTINGGAGDDAIASEGAGSVIDGGDGNDDIGAIGAASVKGGAGRDLVLVTDVTTVDLGDGDDTVGVSGSAGHVTNVAGGAGNDRIVLNSAAIVATGAGTDTIVVRTAAAASTVSDFSVGQGGDTIDVAELLLSSTWDGVANPFDSGHLRLTQSGADTLVEFAADAASYSTLLVLRNVSENALTVDNFVGAFDPSPFSVITGTELDDELTGTDGRDQILGLDGNDAIDGGLGDDILEGGAGNDTIEDDHGANTFIGGDGNDTFRVNSANSIVHGGAGTDITYVNANVAGTVTTVYAGDAQDAVWLSGAAVADMGEGDDVIAFDRADEGSRITLGAGRDILVPVSGDAPLSTVTDFVAGAGGDQLYFGDLLKNQPNWGFDIDPFAAGFARLAQSGSDTLVQIDIDGRDNGETFTSVIRLQDVLRENVTGDNLYLNDRWGYDPQATPQPDQIITGDESDNVLDDGSGDDTLYGLGGNDTITGLIGDDALIGGAGNDTLSDRYGRNTFDGGDGDDTIDASGHTVSAIIHAGAGNDLVGAAGKHVEVYAGSGNDVVHLVANRLDYMSSTGIVDGGAGDDRITTSLRATVTAGDGNDWVEVSNADGTFDLGAGDDLIEVRDNPDPGRHIEVTTGAGRDTVKIWGYDAWLSGVVVTDFDQGAANAGDVLNLRDIYTVDSGNGRLSAVVTQANVGQFVKVESDGQGGTSVFVDTDGTVGAHDFVLAASLQNTAQFNLTLDNMLANGNLVVGNF